MTDCRYEHYELSCRPRDSYASAVHGRRSSNDDDHHRDHRREPRQQTTLGSTKATETPWCLTRRCIDGTSRTRVRKLLERGRKELEQTTH